MLDVELSSWPYCSSAPARFRSRRDVDLFLDRERDGRGIIQPIDALMVILHRDSELHEDPKRHTGNNLILRALKSEFLSWLGESKYMYGLEKIPPSRFTKYDANGLWEYSPLLCGAGLAEGLVLSQRLMMHLWEKIPEHTLALHLHNMLVQRGFLENKIDLFAALEGLLGDSFFPNGVPTAKFAQTRKPHVTQGSEDNALRHRFKKTFRDNTANIHKMLDAEFNQFFKAKSSLMMYDDARYVPERIPDKDIRIPSIHYLLRLATTERVIDPRTGKMRLTETELVKRAKARGQTDDALLDAASIPVPYKDTADDDYAEYFIHDISNFTDHNTDPRRTPNRVADKIHGEEIRGHVLLNLLRLDIFADVCGETPISSLNYVKITCHILWLFSQAEDRFRAARHPLWI